MTLDYGRAQKLAQELVAGADPKSPQHATAMKLWAMLEPPLTMAEILELIPAQSVTGRAKLLYVTRQTYYNLRSGTHIPSAATSQRLSALTGVPARAIRGIGRHGG